MKFTINRNLFLNHLNNVVRAVSNRNTIPILTGIKLELTQEHLILIGSDSNFSIQSRIPITAPAYDLKVEVIGSAVLPARIFAEIIRKLPSNQLTIEVGDNGTAIITSGQAKFNVLAQEGEAYPKLPAIHYENKIKLDTTLFKRVINQTIFSTSNQESRPILTGVLFITHSNYLTAIATDSHRLSLRELAYPDGVNQDTFDQITIPKKVLLELSRIMEDDKEISLLVRDQQVIFEFENTVIFSRLLEGTYPDVFRLIPNQHTSIITLNAGNLLSAIDRASLLSREGSMNVVNLELQDNKVTISVKGNEVGRVEEVVDTIETNGKDIKISFNPDYMRDALKSFEDSEIKIQLTEPNRPILLEPNRKNEIEHQQLYQLLTPIRTHA